MARTQKELIKAASIATVLEKHTNKILGFLVKSNRSNDYYQIQTEIIGGERVFFCDCEAKDWGYSECCHIKAVKEVLVAKAELENQEAEEAIVKAATFEALKAQFATPVEAEQGAIHPAIAAYDMGAKNTVSALPEYRWCPVGYIKRIALNGHQFTPAQLAQLNSPANAGFSLLKP